MTPVSTNALPSSRQCCIRVAPGEENLSLIEDSARIAVLQKGLFGSPNSQDFQAWLSVLSPMLKMCCLRNRIAPVSIRERHPHTAHCKVLWRLYKKHIISIFTVQCSSVYSQLQVLHLDKRLLSRLKLNIACCCRYVPVDPFESMIKNVRQLNIRINKCWWNELCPFPSICINPVHGIFTVEYYAQVSI